MKLIVRRSRAARGTAWNGLCTVRRRDTRNSVSDVVKTCNVQWQNMDEVFAWHGMLAQFVVSLLSFANTSCPTSRNSNRRSKATTWDAGCAYQLTMLHIAFLRRQMPAVTLRQWHLTRVSWALAAKVDCVGFWEGVWSHQGSPPPHLVNTHKFMFFSRFIYLLVYFLQTVSELEVGVWDINICLTPSHLHDRNSSPTSMSESSRWLNVGLCRWSRYRQGFAFTSSKSSAQVCRWKPKPLIMHQD